MSNINTSNKKRSQWLEVWRRLKRNKMAVVGLVILIILVLLAVFANVIANYDNVVIKQNLSQRLQAPSAAHWLGTDEFGRDIFAFIVTHRGLLPAGMDDTSDCEIDDFGWTCVSRIIEDGWTIKYLK